MNILGLHYGHDGTACIVRDGKLCAALSDERLNRQKKSHGVSDRCIDMVLETSGITADRVDLIALSDWNAEYSQHTIHVRRNGQDINCTWNTIFGNDVWQMDAEFRGRTLPAYNVGHHMCHCAAAFYTSPFHRALCVSMDSSGGYARANFMAANGDGNCLTAVDGLCCLTGLAFGQFVEKLGIGLQIFKAGSLMALAAYGKVDSAVIAKRDRYYRESLHEHPDGNYRSWVTNLWRDVTGGESTFTHEQSDSERAMFIAAQIEYIFEETILQVVDALPDDCTDICLGGGSFLSCNTNSRVLRDSKFKRVHLFPAASDDGGAVGAALYTAHHIMGEPRQKYSVSETCYLGPNRVEPVMNVKTLDRVAQEIAAGKVVAWMQGRSECGPRALGHRSILADPRRLDMRDRINSQVKRREWYRPLSPSVLAERSHEWFEFDRDSPFMLFTAKCLRPDEVPAVVHVDGSSRMQTVRRKDNPNYYRLIQRFEKITEVPMVLNTSMNVDGEPIVESTEDAERFWQNAAVDMMVLDGEVRER